MNAPCDHQWEWTQPRIVTIGEPYLKGDTYNAKCALCGKTTWAHGWNVPITHRADTHPGPRDPVLEQEC